MMCSNNFKVRKREPLNLFLSIGLEHTPGVFEFVERHGAGQNFIVMQLLGKNLATQKKLLGKSMTVDVAIDYLVYTAL